ncbi:hypothetical protein [Streptomyces sp. NPDC093094]|uniref:hypothetical protein n=1 Tax=Streptomyces sp. NPDC093094 TaxID=3366026 RepID=UPI0038042BD9
MLTDDPTDDPAGEAGRAAATTDDEPELRRFVEQSTTMTGFTAYDLYGTGMARLYLDTARRQVGAPRLTRFLDIWQRAHDSGPPAQLPPLDREIARAVTYLWYTGAWPRLAPAAHAALRREVPNTEFVASASSYPEGLVWRAFAGHPSGAKPPGFGTWALRPPELPTEEEIRGELRAAAEDPSTEAAYAPAADTAVAPAHDVPADGVPAHLLPGPRPSRAVPPSAVPSAAPPPDAQPQKAGE